jgi:hypothetical protein
MTLSRIQKISVVFFIATLIPSYLIANWRLNVNEAVITEEFEREKSLHLSTDKLLLNCEYNSAKGEDHYGAHHQICEQGLKTHARTSEAMESLAQDKLRNETRWYRNFFLTLALFNLLGFALLKINEFSKLERN